MIDKESREWKEYTDEQKKLREAVEAIVSTMSAEDMRYYCYTIAFGAGETRFLWYCTHVIFEDLNLNINEGDIAWILQGNSGICRTPENGKSSNKYDHKDGIDYAFLFFVVMLNSMHLKDILKVFYAVASGYYERFTLEWIVEEYEDDHRIGDEAKELIAKGETCESIAKEAADELEDIKSHDGFFIDGFVYL